MPSIAGKIIFLTSLSERMLKGGENVVEWDNTSFKWVYQVSRSLNMRIWALSMVENASAIALANSVYNDLMNAYKNNTTLTFVCDFAFHNLGAVTVKVYTPPTVQYTNTDKGALRFISVELIEVL
ncbi:MAG: hypothetical protein NZ888_05070 [Candidatus Nitrosocaldus sp.]|nr:hypothetical protein [Candidatus Nitrosocaldus sp.]MDW8000342.1 hypothetical protein [Candidatus Nitrosocaldus sp.]